MKIEISSWETTDSSLHRRRKRPPKDKSPRRLVNDHDPYLAHTFVSHQRTRTTKKARTQGTDDLIPLITLTNETKVAVVGILKGEFTVSQNRQFPCQPGTFFLPTENTDAPRVAAVLEKRTDLMYALQNQNKRLVCWPSVSDNHDDIVSISFEATAVSLEVMPSKFSLVFGCLQGDETKLFLASFDQGERKINMKTFDTQGLPKDTETPLEHVATLGHVQDGRDALAPSQTTGKRKAPIAESGDKRDVLVISQVFASQSTLYIARHEILGEDETDLSSLERRHVKVHKVPLKLHRQEHVSVSLVGAVNDTIVLCCRTASANQFVISLSARDGKVLKGPFEISPQTRRLSLVTTHVIMGQVDDGIVLMDTASGAVLEKSSLPNDIQSRQWTLLGLDWKRSRIFVLHEHETGYSIASAIVNFGEADGASSTCLAARISSSLESRTETDFRGALLRRQRLADRDSGDGGYSVVSTTKKGIEMLEMACSALELSNGNEEGFVTSAFAKALEAMTRAEGTISEETGGDENPQDCHLKKNHAKKNGMHDSASSSKENNPVPNGGKSGKQTLNGHAVAAKSTAFQISKILRRIDPALVSFVGSCAIRILLIDRDIGSARNAARSVLRKVVRSKRASARHLFDSIDGVTLSTVLKSLQRRETEEAVSYSPVELLFDICNCCKDVSEKHMIHGAKYMLLNTKAEEIADYFERTQPLSSESSYRELCDKYRTIKNDKSLESDEKTVERYSSKLLLRGSEAFLVEILTYSDCNETLLRRAITENLARGEVMVFLKLISHVRRVVETHNFNSDVLKRAFLWMSTLFERLGDPRSEEETAMLLSIQRSLASERNATNALRGIRTILESTIADIQEAAETNGKENAGQSRAQLPPYQLERLVF